MKSVNVSEKFEGHVNTYPPVQREQTGLINLVSCTMCAAAQSAGALQANIK